LTDVWLVFSKDARGPGRSYTLGEYVLKMTLEATLLDSETNEVLAIASDRQGKRVNPQMRRLTSVDAWREARRAFKYWAGQISDGLQRASSSASNAPADDS
jgi:hypothetical protein